MISHFQENGDYLYTSAYGCNQRYTLPVKYERTSPVGWQRSLIGLRVPGNKQTEGIVFQFKIQTKEKTELILKLDCKIYIYDHTNDCVEIKKRYDEFHLVGDQLKEISFVFNDLKYFDYFECLNMKGVLCKTPKNQELEEFDFIMYSQRFLHCPRLNSKLCDITMNFI
jgi:hypothetical protein